MMLLFLLLFDFAFGKNFGLTVKGNAKSKCKKKTFKGRFIENCSVSVPSQMQYLTTDSFPSYYTSRMTSIHTLTAAKGMHIRLIFEVIDIDCKLGYLMVKEAKDQSQKLCTSGVQYPNVVSSGKLEYRDTFENRTQIYKYTV